MLQNISISDKCCSSELSIHQPEKIILNTTTIIIIHVFEQQIRILKCFLKGHVTEVMMLKNYILKYIQIENGYFK